MVRRASHSHHDAPDRPAPQRAEHERQPGEHDADLGRRAREQVPDRRRGCAAHSQSDRRDRGDEEREVREPRGRHVEVEQAHRVALLRVGGRHPQRRSTAVTASASATSRAPERVAVMSCVTLPPAAARTPACPTATTSTANATSSCTHGHASDGDAVERGLERPGRAEHHRRDRREHEQRHERLAHARAGGEHAVDRTGRRQSDGRGQRRGTASTSTPCSETS